MSLFNRDDLRRRRLPMIALNLGLPRTGAASVDTALEELGLENIYQFGFHNNNDSVFWIAAMEAKYEGKGEPFGRAEWDHIFWNNDAVSDFPAILFAEDLIAAYPEACVILTTPNSVDSWYNEMLRTVCDPAFKTLYYRAIAWFDPQEARMWAVRDRCEKHAWKGDFARNGREFFIEHELFVKKMVERKRLLVFGRKESEGEEWETLCGFLGAEVPTIPFPKGDTVKKFKEERDAHAKSQWEIIFGKAAILAWPPVLATLIYIFFLSGGE